MISAFQIATQGITSTARSTALQGFTPITETVTPEIVTALSEPTYGGLPGWQRGRSYVEFRDRVGRYEIPLAEMNDEADEEMVILILLMGIAQCH